jgi:hypothetical protein
MRLSDIRIRDPFVLPQPERSRYVLYGTTDETCWNGPGVGFDAYTSANLTDWEGPHPAFRPPANFWATQNFWAPEVHAYQGRYFLLATFKAEVKARGTQILVADNPLGPFLPHSNGPVTPPDWECLDGTLWVENETPYLIFCHEWLQVGDGEICALPLAPDLSQPAGPPTLLFTASSAPWSRLVGPSGKQGHVTDGPFLFRLADGTLAMLWSGFNTEGYCVAVATSKNGVLGPWHHAPNLLTTGGGGHAMLFRAFDGTRYLSLHQPNNSPHERARFVPIGETQNGLQAVPEQAIL